MTRRSYFPHPDLLAPIGYALLALLALQHVLFNAGTHLVDDPYIGITSDYYHFHWNFWWIGHALANGLNVYETNYVFAPFTSSLALHTLSAAWYPVWWIGDALGGTVTGMNAVFFAAMTLTAWACYLLLRHCRIAPGLAFVGGAAIGFSTLMIGSLRWTNINLMGGFWLPVLILIWLRIARAGSWRAALGWGVALGAALWGMLLTDLQYPLLFAPVIVPVGLVTLWRSPGRGRAVAGLIAAGVAAVILLSASGTLPAVLSIDRTGGAPTPAERATDIKFPLCLIANCNNGSAASIVVIPVALALIAIAVFRRRSLPRAAWGWLALAPLPLLLALGDSIAIFGVTVPMPYTVLHNAIGGIFRYPERFLPVFMLPIVIFTGLALTEWTRGDRRWRAAIAVGLFAVWLADSQILDPLPLQPIPRAYAAYQQIAEDPGEVIVLEIPTGGSSGEGYAGRPEYSALQWYGILHGKRMVNGHISRVNTYTYFYMNTDDAMMAWLGQRRFLEADTVEAALRQRIPEWGIGYFVMHRDLIAPDQNAIQEIAAFFNARRDLLCPLLTEGDLVVWRARWHQADCPPTPQSALDIGGPGDALIIGAGWGFPEAIFDLTVRWIGAAPSLLHLDIPPGAEALVVQAQAYQRARTVTVLADGVAIGDPFVVAPDGLAAYTLALPPSLAGARDVTLTFMADGAGEAEGRALAVMVEGIAFP